MKSGLVFGWIWDTWRHPGTENRALWEHVGDGDEAGQGAGPLGIVRGLTKQKEGRVGEHWWGEQQQGPWGVKELRGQ